MASRRTPIRRLSNSRIRKRDSHLAIRFEPLEERRLLHGAEFTGAFEAQDVTGDLNFSSAMAFAPDGRLFVAEKAGAVRVIENGVLLETPFLTVPTDTYWERGLGGIAFDPDFIHNGHVYIYYSYPGDIVVNRLSRFTASIQDANVADPASELVLLDGIPGDLGPHNGGAMAFGIDGMLYLGIGDGFRHLNSQSLASLSGKVLRLDVANYPNLIPDDNPFVNTPGARGEIYALGFRNPFTLAIHPVTGEIFVNDVGLATWEEINVLEPGGNYGWRPVEGPSDNPAYINPLYALHHNGRDAAIVGSSFYTSNQYPEEFFNDYFFGEYVAGTIDVLDRETGEVSRFASHLGRIVDIDLGPDGALYWLTYDGVIHKIVYTGDANRAPTAIAEADVENGLAPFTVHFSGAESSDPDGDELTYTWNFGDGSEPVTGVEVSHEFTIAGDYEVRLTVNDGRGGERTSAPLIVRAGNTSPTASITLTTRDDFVIALYQDTLNRDPDPAGALYWRGQLQAGVSASVVSLAFLQSAERRAMQVASFYRDILGRDAVGGEGNYWKNLLAAGEDARNVMVGFCASQEFSSLYPDDADFIAAIYDVFFHRNVEPDGSVFWTDQLEEGLTREAFAKIIAFSDEYLLINIARLFTDLIGRSATTQERDFWSLYGKSHNLDQLKAAIMGTPTYANAVSANAYPDAPGREYRGGDTILFEALAQDAEDGTLPASAFEWTIEFHHQSHFHPFLGPIEDIRSGSFVISKTGETSHEVWYRVKLKVTDSRGATFETFQDVFPHLAQLTIASDPPGAPLRLDDGPALGDQTVTAVAGLERKITAPAVTEIDGKLFVFDSWSNGGAADQVISAPLEDLVITARYIEVSVEDRARYQFVARIHRELTREEIDPATLTQQVTRVLADGSREPLTTEIYDSLAARLVKIGAYYTTLLGRLPSSEELQVQAATLLADGDIEVILRVVESLEYYVLVNPNKERDFVASLYNDFLGRAPDASADLFVAMLQNGATPRDVALQILTSPEYFGRLTELVFQAYLDRAPTVDELAFWTPLLLAGTETERTLRIDILTSNEYFAKPV